MRDYITLWGWGNTLEELIAHNNGSLAKLLHHCSTFAAHRHIKYLRSWQKESYYKLKEAFNKGELMYDQMVEGVGYVHQHPRRKYPIFCVYEPNEWGSYPAEKDPRRETFPIYRLKEDVKASVRKIVDYYNSQVGASANTYTEERYYFDYGRYQNKLCYLDRLTKKEREKFNLCKIMEPNTWIDGIGGKVLSTHYSNRDTEAVILDIS